MTADHGPRTTDGAERLWTYADLAKRWGLSERRARDAANRMGLRPVKLGYRLVRFRPASVLKAEEDAERGPKRRGLLG